MKGIWKDLPVRKTNWSIKGIGRLKFQVLKYRCRFELVLVLKVSDTNRVWIIHLESCDQQCWVPPFTQHMTGQLLEVNGDLLLKWILLVCQLQGTSPLAAYQQAEVNMLSAVTPCQLLFSLRCLFSLHSNHSFKALSDDHLQSGLASRQTRNICPRTNWPRWCSRCRLCRGQPSLRRCRGRRTSRRRSPPTAGIWNTDTHGADDSISWMCIKNRKEPVCVTDLWGDGQAAGRCAFSRHASASAHRSVIAICSSMAEPVFAFQLPEMDVLLEVKDNH